MPTGNMGISTCSACHSWETTSVLIDRKACAESERDQEPDRVDKATGQSIAKTAQVLFWG